MKTVNLLRVDFALIPDDPLFTAVIDASQTITDEYYYNENIIDANTFPPHVSLHICTVPRDRLPQITAHLGKLAVAGLPTLNPIGVEASSGGYVMLSIERSPDIMAMHEAVLDIAAAARGDVAGEKYGNQYTHDLFDPHISLAKVDYNDQSSATKIGQQAAGKLQMNQTRTFDLCDIGERSERWDVLATFCN